MNGIIAPQRMENVAVLDLIELIQHNLINFRDYRQGRVKTIKDYLENNLLEETVYFPAITVNITGDRYEMIDGSKRVQAIYQVYNEIKTRMKSDQPQEVKRALQMDRFLESSYLSVQMFEGLTQAECDQLYVDFNTKGKKVALSKRIAYDSRNSVNQITNELLHGNPDLMRAGIEMEKQAVIKPTNSNFLSLSQLRQLTMIFLTGSIPTGKVKENQSFSVSEEDVLVVMNHWLKELFYLHSSETIGNYRRTMLASYAVLQALAFYAVEGLKEKKVEDQKREISMRMKKLHQIDWQPENPIWETFKGSRKGREQYYFIDKDKSTLHSLASWFHQVKEVENV